MDVVDAVHTAQGSHDLGGFHRRGGVLAENHQDLAPEHDGTHRDEQGDCQRDPRVPPRLPGDRDHQPGDDDTD